MEKLTNLKADDIRKLSKKIKNYVSGDIHRLSELKEYITELEVLNEDLSGRTTQLASERLIYGGVGTFLAIILTVFFRDMTPIFLEDVGVGEHSIDLYNAIYINLIASIVVPVFAAFLVVWMISYTNRELSKLNYFISRNKAFIACAKHIYETETKNQKD